MYLFTYFLLAYRYIISGMKGFIFPLLGMNTEGIETGR